MKTKQVIEAKTMGIPYKTFKQKIAIMKQFQDKYFIENLETVKGKSGVLYMTLREDKQCLDIG